MQKNKTKNIKKRPVKKHYLRKTVAVIVIAGVVILLAFIGYFLWNSTHSLPASTSGYEQILSSNVVKVAETDSYYSITSTDRTIETTTGLVIYPGAFVEPKGYVASYAGLVTAKTSVFVLKSPLNFALLNTNQAEEVIRAYPNISTWYVAGHSLGGVAACSFAQTHQSQVSGLILLASYCNGSALNLSIPVMSISGSLDGLATPAKITASKKDLPDNTVYDEIQGQNHTQFGSFARTQDGDNPASISQQQSIDQIQKAIQILINRTRY